MVFEGTKVLVLCEGVVSSDVAWHFVTDMAASGRDMFNFPGHTVACKAVTRVAARKFASKRKRRP